MHSFQFIYYIYFFAFDSYVLSGGDLSLGDYNGRTALHQACAEGHIEIVKHLVNQFKVPQNVRDRYIHYSHDVPLVSNLSGDQIIGGS